MSNQELTTLGDKVLKEYGLLKWQVEFLKYLMLPKALRPHRSYIMAKLGITENVYYFWLRHPTINRARRELVKQYYQDDIPDILYSMKMEALAGNERAARLFLEYVDDFRSEDPSNPNIAPPKIPLKEVNIIINNLEQKFYGDRSKQSEPIEGECEPST
jgi:hypothetical protein